MKLPVEPGHHLLRASAPGKKPASVAIDVKADGLVTRIVVPELVSDVGVAAPQAPVPPSPSASSPSSPSPGSPPDVGTGGTSAPWRTIGLVSAGAGLVAIGIGGAFGVIAKSKRDESNAQPGGCLNDKCPPSAAATREDARSAGNTSTVLFVVGGVLAAAGVTMFLVAPRRDARALRVAPSVAASDARLTLEGRF